MKNNQIELNKLKSKLKKKEDISINKDTTINSRELIVIKNDGREQIFDFSKIEKMILWSRNNDKNLTKMLIDATSIKLYNKMKTIEIQEQLIKTAESLISRLNPQWEYVAAKLYLVKLYKDSYNIGGYPHMKEYLNKAFRNRVLDKEIFDNYTPREIDELNNNLVAERDFLFTYKGLKSFADSYILKTSNTKKPIELPQLTYMRVAMSLHYKKTGRHRIERVLRTYNNISTFKYTLATPIMLNAGTFNFQLRSCVLNDMRDNSISIMDTNKNLAIYSKFKGGTSLNIDELRRSGSYINGNDGKSSGPVPFIKITETIMKAWNQGGKRPGMCAIYFSCWHYNFEELIVLKSNGGTDENRARGLKYGVKINNVFLQRWIKNEEYTLFNPSETPKLLTTYGKEFEEAYLEYENTPGLLKKKLSARDMWEMVMKERSETGNIYLFNIDNVNMSNMLGVMVKQSNLCAEIVEYTKPSILLSEELYFDKDMKAKIRKEYEAGEIALCNLLSYNFYDLYKDDAYTDEEIYQIIESGMEAMDATFDVQFYPSLEAEYSNNKWRYVGLGGLNYAKLLASKKIKFDSQEALEFTRELFDDWSYKILKISCEMAKKYGAFPNFKNTEWAKGYLPVFKANKKALALTEFQPDMEKWEELSKEIVKYGLRFALHMAIAPTATSGVAINSTPSIEPIFDFEFQEESSRGTITTLAPEIKKYGMFYVPAFEADQNKLMELAAIRQIYLDQSQSVNVYYKPPFSLKQLSETTLYGFSLGVKTLYYFQTKKDGDEDICKSCT